MHDVVACWQCGAPLGNDAPEGFCPACMLEGALNVGADAPKVVESELPASFPHLRDYQVLDEIARGGMGIVYRARQLSLGRIVAIKLILAGQFAEKAGVQRFKAEASAAAKLHHPNIVAIHEIGEQSGQHFFSMEYIEGQNLADFMRQHPVSIRQVAQLVKKIAEAVHYAHEQGIIHRDLKPSNILIDGLFELRITDFGLARDLKSDADLTVTGQVLGSPNYISPEQASGKRAIGTSTDVYSLGAILYHLLTGRPPFAAETLAATLHQVTAADPVSARILNPSVPRDLETICLKCLEKEPSSRYPTAQVLADELGRFLNDEPIHARPIRAPAKAWRWCRRKPAVAGLTGAFAVSLLLGLIGVIWQWQRAERHLYFSTMRLAQDELDRESIGRARELLGKYIPKWWNRDLRGWEWHYWWNQCRGDELSSISAYPGLGVCSVAVSSNGHLLAIGGVGPVILWDIIKNQQLTLLRQSNYATVYSLGFSKDDKRLLVGTSDGRVLVWNLQSRLPDLVLSNFTSVRSLKISPDGKLLAVYAHAGLSLWSLTTYAKLYTFLGTEEGDNVPGGVAFSPDSSALAFGRNNGEIVLWDTVSRKQITTLIGHEQNVTALAFSPDGSTLVSGSRDRTVRVFDVNSGRELKRLVEFPAFVCGLSISPDGRLLSIVGAGQHVRLIETEFWQQINTLKGHEGGVRAVIFTPDGRKIITGSGDGTVKFWPASESAHSFSQRLPATVSGAALLARGNGLHLRFTNETYALWSVDPLKEISRQRYTVAESAPSVVSADGRLWACATTDHVRIYEHETQSLVAEVPSHHLGPRIMAFSFDGQLLAIEGPGNSCQIWSIKPPKNPALAARLTSFRLTTTPVTTLKFSQDGRYLAVLTKSGSKVEVWTISSGAKVEFATNAVQNDIAISQDGSTAVTACATGKLRVWNLRNGSQVKVLGGQLGTLWSVAFSPDETRIFSCGGDGTVRIWDRGTMEEVAILKLHKERLEQLVLSPSGETLFVLGRDAFRGLRVFTLRAPKLPAP